MASHYSSDDVFGKRALMHVPPGGGVTSNVGKATPSGGGAENKKARLVIQSLRPEDRGLYKCRTDFKKSPTKNYKRNLTILGKKEN